MPKPLAGKSQKIVPKLNPTESKFSGVLNIEPDEKEAIVKKGSLYALFEIEDTIKYETDLTANLIKDILGREYYHSDNASPIQALEKAILEVQENIFHLKESGENPQLNVITTVLWAGVLYTVKKGRGKVFIVRGGHFKEVEMAQEGAFAVATGSTKAGDVIVMATEEFAQNFPPKKLLKFSAKDRENLSPSESCIMVKFEKAVAEPEQYLEVSKHFGAGGVRRKYLDSTRIFAELQEKWSKRKRPNIRDIRKKRQWHFKINPKTTTKLIIISLLVTLGITIKVTKDRTSKSKGPLSPISTEVKNQQNTKTNGGTDKYKVFYDLRILDENIRPKGIAITNDRIYILAGDGTLYESPTGKAQFERVSNTKFEGATKIIAKENELYFNGITGVRRFDLGEKTTKEIKTEASGIFYPYLDYIYQIEDNQIKKYKMDEPNTPSIWTTNNELKGAKDMAITINIFVISKDGQVLRFTGGRQDNGFKVAEEIRDVEHIKAKWDMENLFLTGKGQVWEIDRQGHVIRDIEGDLNSWQNIVDIDANSKENSLFVLDGTKLYKIDLEEIATSDDSR